MPPLGKKTGGGKVKGRKTISPDGTGDYGVPPPPPMPGDEYSMPTREILRPDNQLELTETQLVEEIAKMLTANNPEAPKNIARFNMKERTYKFEPMVDQTIVHYATDGWLLHKTSEEAKKQHDIEKLEAEAAQRLQAEADRLTLQHERPGGNEDAGEGPDDSKQLRNQFNFSERAAQTLNFPLRDRENFTEPPPTATASGSCMQWQIYDEYIKDLERQKQDEIMKSRGNKPKAVAPPVPAADKPGSAAGGPRPNSAAAAAGPQSAGDANNLLLSPGMPKAALILDRMTNQNMYEEIAMDFKYWEDASDAFRPGEGTLLPLWKFTNEKAKRRQVTSICWNPRYLDLFAVGYGSYEFLKQTSGLICIYSLKNPLHPEFTFHTESGVMSVHFHPDHAHLLAVGCYDGTVLVFDVHADNGGQPIYQATVVNGKHNDPVWQVCWQADDSLKALQFSSISSDGSVAMWTLNKSELTHETLMSLKVLSPTTANGAISSEGGGGDEDGAAVSPAGGCCMDFCKGPGQEHIYLVGTEEGAMHKCSKAYSSEYLSTYQGHSLAVYAVKWNHVHHRMFLSASADWSVKLWDSAVPARPVMSFDLATSVGDIAWAPYSASVFVAVTDDGKVHVFDLAENKLVPLCSQKVVKKSKLTTVVFNPNSPILLVGDDHGCVTSLKLSPNLRRTSKPEKGQNFQDMEVAKLDKVVEIARKSEVDSHGA